MTKDEIKTMLDNFEHINECYKNNPFPCKPVEIIEGHKCYLLNIDCSNKATPTQEAKKTTSWEHIKKQFENGAQCCEDKSCPRCKYTESIRTIVTDKIRNAKAERDMSIMSRLEREVIKGNLIKTTIYRDKQLLMPEVIFFQDKKLHFVGECVRCYENGEREFVANFRKGKLHGKRIEYYKNGMIKEEHNYKNGKKHGKCMDFIETVPEFPRTGSHIDKLEKYYQHGKLKKCKVFNKNGDIVQTTTYNIKVLTEEE